MRRALGLLVLLLATVIIGCSSDDRASSGSSDGDVNTESSENVAGAESGETAATTESGDVVPSMEETPPAGDPEPSAGPVEREGGVVLYLHADATVTSLPRPGQALSPEELRNTLTEAVAQYRAAASTAGNSEGGVTLVKSGWTPTGPTVDIVADPGATHGDLDELLKTCVDCQCEKFVLRSAPGGQQHEFALRCPALNRTPPDPNQLPPIKVRMQADEGGRLNRLRLNQKQLNDFQALRGYLMAIIGDDRGPNSIQATVEVAMHCDPGLQLQHLFECLEAVSGYTSDDGTRIALVEKIRPVPWGGGEMEEIEVFEEGKLEEIDVTPTEIVPDTTENPALEGIQEEDIRVPANAPDAPP